MGNCREQEHPDQISDPAAGIDQRFHDHKTENGKSSPANTAADPVQYSPIGNAEQDSSAVRSFDRFQKAKGKMIDEHGHDRDHFQCESRAPGLLSLTVLFYHKKNEIFPGRRTDAPVPVLTYLRQNAGSGPIVQEKPLPSFPNHN